MKKILKKIIVTFLVLIFFSELISYTLGKLKIIPQGVSDHVTIFANENLSYWHPKNIKFKYHATGCFQAQQPSIVYYNNIGARGRENVYIKKIKPRIALIGDEMIENIYVSEGLDFASMLRKKINNFEIINFSARSTGLGDQIDIYKNLIKKYNVDYVFLFITDNDFLNNHYTDLDLFRARYKIINNEVVKISRNKEWFKKYNSLPNKLKRSNLILYIKNYSNTFKLYFYFKVKKNLKAKSSPKYLKAKEISNDAKIKIFNENKIIYNFLVNKFINELNNDNIKYFAFLNIKPYMFNGKETLNQKEIFNFFKIVWNDKNIYYPLDSSIKYLKNRKENWSNHKCNDYPKIGSEFMSNYISDIFNKNK